MRGTDFATKDRGLQEPNFPAATGKLTQIKRHRGRRGTDGRQEGSLTHAKGFRFESLGDVVHYLPQFGAVKYHTTLCLCFSRASTILWKF